MYSKEHCPEFGLNMYLVENELSMWLNWKLLCMNWGARKFRTFLVKASRAIAGNMFIGRCKSSPLLRIRARVVSNLLATALGRLCTEDVGCVVMSSRRGAPGAIWKALLVYRWCSQNLNRVYPFRFRCFRFRDKKQPTTSYWRERTWRMTWLARHDTTTNYRDSGGNEAFTWLAVFSRLNWPWRA